jgi:hypothetical protein
MLESETPRAGSACPPTAADNCDPINGREWTTNKGDLYRPAFTALIDQVSTTLIK